MSIFGFKLPIWNSAQRQAYRELASMSDRELNDIGIARCEIRRIIEEMSK